MYYDINGLIVQQNMDGGDTAGREGDYWFAEALYSKLLNKGISFDSSRVEFKRILTLLQPRPGVFVRNPIQYNNPKDFSRDQTIPLILAMGEMHEYTTLYRLFEKQIDNNFRYQNGDIGFFQDFGYYIRACYCWYFYPILFLGDFCILIESVIRCIQGKDPNNVSDDINHTLVLLQAQHNLETPISWLARKIYKWFRPGGIQKAWDNYFNTASGANDFNDIYRQLIGMM